MEALSEEKLVEEAQIGNKRAMEYIIKKYRGQIKGWISPYYLVGGDDDDLCQEGLIGLYKAIKGYLPDRGGAFSSFARLSVVRQVYTALRQSTRQKHLPLRDYIPIDKPICTSAILYGQEEDQLSIHDLYFADNKADPELILTKKEDLADLAVTLRDILSKQEHKVIQLYAKGFKRKEIAAKLGLTEKTVDNALNRTWRKTRKLKSLIS